MGSLDGERVDLVGSHSIVPDAEQRTVELRADCAVGRVFERLLVPQTVVTPAGFLAVFTWGQVVAAGPIAG